MSNQAPPQVSGRKICVPRRRCGANKPASQSQLTQNTGPSSFNFTPIGTSASTDRSEATLQKQGENKPDSSSGPLKTDKSDAVPLKNDTTQDAEAEGNPDTFADAAAAASAFSQMSLHEKPARWEPVSILALGVGPVGTWELYFKNSMIHHGLDMITRNSPHTCLLIDDKLSLR